MSKAKQKAFEAYPIKIAEREGYDENLRERKGFIKGYHQAEKDLALTWEDIDWIVGEAVRRVTEDCVAEQVCKKVLKRFKAMKEK